MPQHDYQTVYSRWLSDPQGFWSEAAEAIHWDRPWDKVLDDGDNLSIAGCRRAPEHLL